jgi:hypothetical protein
MIDDSETLTARFGAVRGDCLTPPVYVFSNESLPRT